ncbi:MAG: cytochrome b/b6 domain-containing protein [Rhodobacteraceae bacterium]|nr:cytochrome b/b6 domain-containing protein [Paracoccaceae bacterium]
MPVPAGYSRTQIALHWVVVLLILAQFLFHEPMAEAWDVVEDGGAAVTSAGVLLHIIGGIAVLVFALWRLALRMTRGVPALPANDPPLQRLAAHLGHWGLYALMVAVPLSGMAAWGGGIKAAGEAHEVLKTLLLLLVLVHVAAALWHQFWLKDGLIDRMKRPG